MMKECKLCLKTKNLTDFYPHKSCALGVRPICKKCMAPRDRERTKEYIKNNPEKRRSTILTHRFGISKDVFDQMLASQDGKCKICKSKDPGASKKFFSVDHDHVTGKIRGILCHGCNAGLGMFKDNINSLESAIEYLKESK